MPQTAALLAARPSLTAQTIAVVALALLFTAPTVSCSMYPPPKHAGASPSLRRRLASWNNQPHKVDHLTAPVRLL